VLHLLIALQTAVQVPPPPRGYGTTTAEVVVDAAQVIPPSSVDQINRIAFDVHEKSRGEIAVVTLPYIGLRAPVDVALAIGRAWGVGANTAIGQQTRNAGVVILLVPKETSSTGRGECFITTGQGTEGFITDAEAASWCREAIPLFQQQQYGPALERLTARVAGEFAREFGFTLDSTSRAPPVPEPDVQRSRGRSTGGLSPFAIFVLFIVAYMILSSFGRRRGCSGCIPIPIVLPTGGGYHRGGWGGGGFGGGGGGFGGFGGGGGFSGGGGGSSW
jgi:uncharacterized protein